MNEWKAAEYVRGSDLQQAMADEALALIHADGDEHVLDIGCGDGRITTRIARIVPRGLVVGLDPSADMISFAMRSFPVSTVPNLRFEIGDGARLPHKGAFDLVVSFNALHWIPDQGRALESIAGALKRGGEAVIRMVLDGPCKSLETTVEETRRAPRWTPYFQSFCDPYLHLTPEAYGQLADRSGLKVQRLRTQHKAWDFECQEQFAAFCTMGCRAWTRRLPDAASPAFIVDVLDRYGAATGQKPGDVKTFFFYQMDIVLTLAET